MRVEDALVQARRMVEEGASIIDIGGESTRPGARPVPPEEQLRRILPVLRALAGTDRGAGLGCRLSVDTASAAVAEAALAEGATIVNDVSAGLEDERMLAVVAAAGADLILMHRRVRPEHDSYSDRYGAAPRYRDVVDDVAVFLHERVEAALRAGVPSGRLAIDPGFGFGKSVEQNYELLARLEELAPVHPRLFVGLSRKSFLRPASAVASGLDAAVDSGEGSNASSRRSPSGQPFVASAPPAERLPESIAAALLAAQAGASIIRVHDVGATRQALEVLRRVARGRAIR